VAPTAPEHDARTLVAVAVAGLAPIFVAATLVPLRGRLAGVNVVLLLTLVVVASGALGGRVAGAAAALTAALSYDFFHTRPYLSLLIHDADEVEMTVLLLVVGLSSGQLAWRARMALHQLARGRSELDRIRHLADLVARGIDAPDVILAALAEFSSLFDLVDSRFDAVPFTGGHDLPRLERNGVVAGVRYRFQPGGELELELPEQGMVLPVLARGQIIGRFVFQFRPGATASLEQRVVAVALADQVGASLAVYQPPLRIRSTRRPDG